MCVPYFLFLRPWHKYDELFFNDKENIKKNSNLLKKTPIRPYKELKTMIKVNLAT